MFTFLVKDMRKCTAPNAVAVAAATAAQLLPRCSQDELSAKYMSTLGLNYEKQTTK
jgi:hypothetical protein